MKRWVQSLAVIAGLLPVIVRAEVGCFISGFQVDAYDHAGTYIHGTLTGGQYVSFMSICGVTSGAQDCNSKATDRRLAVALAAQAQGKTLYAYFAQLSSCSQVQPYMVISGLRTAD
jgi:hypothetical protein